MSLLDPRGHRIRAIEYVDDGVPRSVVVDDGGNAYYDFEWCERDRRLYWHCSGGGPKTPVIELAPMACPDLPGCTLWLDPKECAEVDGGLSAEEGGYQVLTDEPPNPFENAWEDKCYLCEWCDDWLPQDRPCGHLCDECEEAHAVLLDGVCGDCCLVELDGVTIWEGEYAQWVVRFDDWGEPWREAL